MAFDKDKEDRVKAIIRPALRPNYEVAMMWSGLEKTLLSWERDYGAVDLNPDFQRGHVWSGKQQKHYIEKVLRGLVGISGLTLQFNCPEYASEMAPDRDLPAGYQCLDGLQRLTAVRDFIAGRVEPFGLSLDELEGTSFFPLRPGFRFHVTVFDYQKRADVLQHYLDHNAGGTQHSDDEIARVRALLEADLMGKAREQRSSGASPAMSGPRG